MRTGPILAFLAAAVTLQAADPLVLPSCVRDFSELPAAQQEAAAANKGIAFLLMEPGST